MSVYIKGFPLPNNCGACPLRLAWCRERIYMVTRPERCPLVHVPEHGEMANADRIRAMSDEELADRIMGFVRCEACEREFHIECNPLMTCRGVWLEWLKSPVEADNG